MAAWAAAFRKIRCYEEVSDGRVLGGSKFASSAPVKVRFAFVPDVILNAHKAEVIKIVGLGKKPAIFAAPDWVANGGLMSFAPDFADATRHLIAQVDRLLKGAKPSDLSFERPTKFDLRINLRIFHNMIPA